MTLPLAAEKPGQCNRCNMEQLSNFGTTEGTLCKPLHIACDCFARYHKAHPNDKSQTMLCAGDNVQPTLHDAVLRQARMRLIEHGDCPADGIDARLARSWQRSLAAGLSPMDRLADFEHANAIDLRQILTRNHELLAHSRPVMEYLFDQVRASEGMVILADQRGTLMHTLGHPDFLNKAQRVALTSGV